MNKLLFYFALGLIFCHSIKAYSQELNNESLPGYLKIEIRSLDSVYVAINDDFDSVLKIASGDTLTLSPGSTKLRIMQMYYQDLVRSVQIEEGKIRNYAAHLQPVRGNEQISRRSSYPRLFWGANNFILSDPETDLFIDGVYIGSHYASIDTVGRFEVQGVHVNGDEFTKSFDASAQAPFHFHQMHLKPSRKIARLLSMVPGGSQFYKKQTLKAVAFSVVTLGGAALAVSYESRYQESISEFNRLDTRYNSANNPEEAFRLGAEAEEAYSKAVSLSKNRNRFLYGTALVYLANVVDGFIAPSIGYRDRGRTIDPYLDFDTVYRQPVIGIKSSF